MGKNPTVKRERRGSKTPRIEGTWQQRKRKGESQAWGRRRYVDPLVVSRRMMGISGHAL